MKKIKNRILCVLLLFSIVFTSNSGRNGFQKAWDEVDHESNPSGKIYYMYQGDDYVTYYSDVDYTDWGIRVTENLSEQRETGR